MISKKENPKAGKRQTSFSELRKKSSLGKLNLSQSFIQQQPSFSKLNLESCLEVENLSNQLDNIVRRRSLTSRNTYQSEKYFFHDSKQHPIFSINASHEQLQLKIKPRKWSQDIQDKYKSCEVNNSYLIKGKFQVIQESCAQHQEEDYNQELKTVNKKVALNLKDQDKRHIQNSTKFNKNQQNQDKKYIKSRGSVNADTTKSIKDVKASPKIFIQELQKMGQQLDSKRLTRPSANRLQNIAKTPIISDKTKIVPKYQKESPKTSINNIRQNSNYNHRMKTCGNQLPKQTANNTNNVLKKSTIGVTSLKKQQLKEQLQMTKITEHQNEEQLQIFQKIQLKSSKQLQMKSSSNISSNSTNFMKPTQMISMKQKQKLIQKLQKVKFQLQKNQVQIRSLQEINEVLDKLSSLINF